MYWNVQVRLTSTSHLKIFMNLYGKNAPVLLENGLVFSLTSSFSCLSQIFRIRNCLAQLYAKDITPDDKQELDEALQREVESQFLG